MRTILLKIYVKLLNINNIFNIKIVKTEFT